ncbi:hypothetical protein AAC387_Pa09g0715 [Persea americana]
MLHGKTPTLHWAQAVGFSLASRCCLCKSEQETTLHLLFHCAFVSSIWSWILKASKVSLAGPLSPSKIWHALSNNSDKLTCKGAASIFFSITFVLWKCRNDHLYRNSRVSQMKVTAYLIELLKASLTLALYFGWLYRFWVSLFWAV